MSNSLTRREVLAAGAVLPWLVACGADNSTAGVDLVEGAFSSKLWPGHEVRWRLARPAGKASAAATPPLVIALHGRGGDADSAFDGIHLERHVARTGLAVASVDGSGYYWHARKSGIDTGRMVVEDLLPLMARNGVATGRIGLIGWSMGGYGALLLASRLGPRRVAGAVGVSAALWQSPGDSAPGAFDDADDFRRNDVFAARDKLRAIPIRLDCGSSDPFIVANRAFARGLPHARATFDEGAHNDKFWVPHAGAEMTWLQQRLK